jgi:hypothetical protein
MCSKIPTNACVEVFISSKLGKDSHTLSTMKVILACNGLDVVELGLRKGHRWPATFVVPAR